MEMAKQRLLDSTSKYILMDHMLRKRTNHYVLNSYPISKLMEILAVRHLAPLIPVSRTGVVLNLVCPGLCSTQLDRNAMPAFREDLAKQRAAYGRTAEDGSRTLLHAAMAGIHSHGELCGDCGILE
jgi:NAD(P)-dependent dehydrogenase (short-subunit alcohol dehydrogenase family)